MREDRFGSYSIETTVPGMPALSRLKSIRRSLRLCPPPTWRMVMSPLLRRPPVRSLGVVSDFNGRLVVMSSFTNCVAKRRDAVYGLYVLIAIFLCLLL